MIKEITTFIRDRVALLPVPPVPLLVIDTDLFAGHRPQAVADACDVILESTGGEAFFELPERADPVIQVLSRARTYFTARARAHVIYDAIFRIHTVPDVAPRLGYTYGSAGWTLPLVPLVTGVPYEAMVIVPLSPPQYIGQDEKLRHEFSTNYIFKVKRL